MLYAYANSVYQASPWGEGPGNEARSHKTPTSHKDWHNIISAVPYSNTKPLKKPQITMERWSTLNHMVVGNPACGIRIGNDLTTVIWLPITPHRLTDMADC